METCREIISDVVGELRSIGIDDRIPNRTVLHALQEEVSTLIKQEADSRRLFNVTNVWKSIPCLKMYEVNVSSCGELDCRTLRKSVDKVPEVFDSNYGDLIKVFTVDGDSEYHQIKPFEYKDIKNREYKDPNQRYFWILDQHVYIPDSEVQEVMVIGLFKFPNQVTQLVEGPNCLPALDEIFPCPGWLVGIVHEQVTKSFADRYKRIVPDARPDADPNKKE